jgi:HEAT repeat protein
LRAIRALGSTAIQPLISSFDHSKPTVQANILNLLAQWPDARTMKLMIASLSDHHSIVRISAADGLRCYNTPAAVESLLTALEDGDADVRTVAANALGQAAVQVRPALEISNYLQAKVVKALAVHLVDVEAKVKLAACESLGACKIETPSRRCLRRSMIRRFAGPPFSHWA